MQSHAVQSNIRNTVPADHKAQHSRQTSALLHEATCTRRALRRHFRSLTVIFPPVFEQRLVLFLYPGHCTGRASPACGLEDLNNHHHKVLGSQFGGVAPSDSLFYFSLLLTI